MNVGKSISGVEYLLAGFGIICQPGLRRFVIIPLIVNLVFFLGMFFLFKHLVYVFDVWFLQHVPSWLQWLGSIIWLMFFASFFVFFIYAFVVFANLIAAPFNNLLAEKVEIYLTGAYPQQTSIWDNLKDIPRVFWRQICIIAYFIPRALVFLLIFFIPIINVAAPILWFLLGAWFMAMQFLDFPTDNHKIPLPDVRAWASQHRWSTLGLGVSILLAMMIPGINLVTMPAAVAAATKFWVDENH